MSCEKKILIKRSSTAGSKPATSDLQDGELAINYSDGIIYSKNTEGNILQWTNDGEAVIDPSNIIKFIEQSNFEHNSDNNVWDGQSLDIGDNETAYILFEIRGDIMIDWTVSSEENYDYLTVDRDGEEVLKTSGSYSGRLHILDVEPGDVVLVRIEYSKDLSVSQGSDSALFENMQAV